MQDSDSLEALSNLLSELSNNPYDISLHSQYIRLAEASGMKDQIQAAREMMINFWPADEKVWIPIINSKLEEGADDVESVQEILAQFEIAEMDYLSIPILHKHMNFVIDRHMYFASLDTRPTELGEIMFTVDWTRAILSSIFDKGSGHLSQSHILWNELRDWELVQLESSEGNERQVLIMLTDDLYLRRLRQAHAELDETFQSYSTFTSTYRSATEYESLLVSASKAKAQAGKAWEKREQYEMSLTSSKFSPEAYAYYIANERKAKKVDMFVLSTLYERAITDAAKRRFDGDLEAEHALRIFWAGYCDTLRTNEIGDIFQLQTLKRALRSTPTSGEIWSRYMRFVERHSRDEDLLTEMTETIPEIYEKALATGLLQKDVDQFVPVVLARAGYEKRLIESDNNDEGDADQFFKIIEEGIETVRNARKQGDPQFRLERFFADFCISELPDTAVAVWQSTAKHYKSSYLAWTTYIDLLGKQEKIEEARLIFKDIVGKNLDWPEAIFEAWISFEHLHGSVEEIDECMDRVERAQSQLVTRRAREAEKQAYQASQVTAQAQTSVPVVEAQATVNSTAANMDIDIPQSEITQTGQKRKADDPTPNGGEAKKAKTEQTPTLKRDRENCTVFVADMPSNVSKEDLEKLFKDCGAIREVKIVNLPNSIVSTVEFMDRESIPAALTKDKKRLNGKEVSVHLSWQSTLYVTNFPEKTTDESVRELFGKFGQIFDVRWPSKKFKNSRRFCYVQFTAPEAAQAALSLQGQELEPGLALSVYISDPGRRKERTDAGNNNKEIYVAGLSKFANKGDLEKLFSTYGAIKDVRMAIAGEGKSKGFAFVEFEDEESAKKALQANNFDFKNRRIAVTLADSRVRARQQNEAGSRGLALKNEIKSRSVRIKGLPEGTQEGLLQQIFEKVVSVKRVEVFEGKREAVIELPTIADAGRLLLLTEPLKYNGAVLKITEEEEEVKPSEASRAGGMFVPRAAASRPRAGIGSFKRKPEQPGRHGNVDTSMPPPPSTSSSKSQDEFRKMLG